MGANDVIALDANFEQWKKDRLQGFKKVIDAFEYYSVDQFLKPFGVSDEELQSGIVGGHKDGGVDAMYFFVNRKLIQEESDLDPQTALRVNLLIMQTKEGDGFSPIAIDKLVFFTDDLLDLARPEPKYHQTYRPQLLELMRLFKSKYQLIVGAFPEIVIEFYYITKLDVDPNEDCNRAVEKLKATARLHFSKAVCDFHFVNAPRLWNQVQVRPRKSKPLKWTAQPLETPEGWVGLVNLKDYYVFLKDEHGELAESTFESNVRGYWPNTPVNKGIQRTLESPGQADFWLLNNGITILAARTMPAGFSQLEIEDPQIVNGLQTSREIYSYFRDTKNLPGSDPRRILVRIIQTADKAVRDDVIRATNSQNKMPDEALRATDPIHRQIESLFSQYDLFYDRRKGQYKDEGKPIEKIVSVLEVLQAMLSVVLKRPDDARARPRNYLKDEAKYVAVFGDNAYDLTVYLKSTMIFRRVDGFLDEMQLDIGHRRNTKFYLAMYVVCAKARNAYAPPGELLKIDVSSISNEFIQQCYDRVWKQYERGAKKYRTNGEYDYDLLAKGPNLLKSLNTELKRRFNPLKREQTSVAP